MTRLTNDLRNDIANAAMKHAFTDEVGELMAQRRDLAFRVWVNVCGIHHDAIRNMPDGWLPKVGCIGVKFGTDYISLPFSGDFDRRNAVYSSVRAVPEAVWRPIMASKANGCAAVYEPAHFLTADYDRLIAAAADLKERWTKANAAIRSTLASVSTVKALLVAWPEVAKFIPEKTEADNLPAVQIADLNAMFGLP